jgi:hypothetical protein
VGKVRRDELVARGSHIAGAPAEIEQQVGDIEARVQHRLGDGTATLGGNGLEPGTGDLAIDGREVGATRRAIGRRGCPRIRPGQPGGGVVAQPDVHHLGQGEPLDPVRQVGRNRSLDGFLPGASFGGRSPRGARRGRQPGHAADRRRSGAGKAAQDQ